MKLTVKFTVDVPQSFLKWLKANGFKRIGRSFLWKREKSVHAGCSHLVISINAEIGSYNIQLDWCETLRGGKSSCYDSVVWDSFKEFEERIKLYEL